MKNKLECELMKIIRRLLDNQSRLRFFKEFAFLAIRGTVLLALKSLSINNSITRKTIVTHNRIVSLRTPLCCPDTVSS